MTVSKEAYEFLVRGWARPRNWPKQTRERRSRFRPHVSGLILFTFPPLSRPMSVSEQGQPSENSVISPFSDTYVGRSRRMGHRQTHLQRLANSQGGKADKCNPEAPFTNEGQGPKSDHEAGDERSSFVGISKSPIHPPDSFEKNSSIPAG